MADGAGALSALEDFNPRPFWTGVLIGAGIIAAVELHGALTNRSTRRG